MIFDSLTLAAVADEIGRALVGGKVERVAQPSPLEIVLTVYAHGAKRKLLLSADPQAARVHLTTVRRDSPPPPPAFCMLLRKHLEGTVLEDATLPHGLTERVLRLQFRVLQDGARCALIAETMGKHSNIVLVSAAGLVLGAAKIITREVNRVRETRPGLPYVPPPPQRGRIDPFSHLDAAVPPSVPGAEAAWLAATFAGVSPLLAQEAVLHSPTPLTGATLLDGLRAVLDRARPGGYAPRVWEDGHGRALGAYPIPLLSVPARDQRPCDSISAALDEAASSQAHQDTFTQAQDALQAALHRTLRARLREQDAVQKGLDNADRADEYQQAGELLLAQPRPAGASPASVTDYYAPPNGDGTPALRLIPIDPALDGRANAERYFKKARKARDSRATLAARLAALAGEVALLTQAATDARDAATAAEVAAVRDGIGPSLLHAPPGGESGQAPATQAPAFEGHKIKRFQSPDGWEILVGENATSNDYLTTRVAAPSDIWLHVRAGASAHGVIRAGGRPASVSPAALRLAAEMVAARSEVKHSSLIAVDYTLKKYVRKPRKSAPGAVTYANEKTISVTGI